MFKGVILIFIITITLAITVGKLVAYLLNKKLLKLPKLISVFVGLGVSFLILAIGADYLRSEYRSISYDVHDWLMSMYGNKSIEASTEVADNSVSDSEKVIDDSDVSNDMDNNTSYTTPSEGTNSTNKDDSSNNSENINDNNNTSSNETDDEYIPGPGEEGYCGNAKADSWYIEHADDFAGDDMEGDAPSVITYTGVIDNKYEVHISMDNSDTHPYTGEILSTEYYLAHPETQFAISEEIDDVVCDIKFYEYCPEEDYRLTGIYSLNYDDNGYLTGQFEAVDTGKISPVRLKEDGYTMN